MYVKEEVDIPKNYKILKDNNISYEQMINKMGIDSSLDELTSFKMMKEHSNRVIKLIIQGNRSIFDAIFFRHWCF